MDVKIGPLHNEDRWMSWAVDVTSERKRKREQSEEGKKGKSKRGGRGGERLPVARSRVWSYPSHDHQQCWVSSGSLVWDPLFFYFPLSSVDWDFIYNANTLHWNSSVFSCHLIELNLFVDQLKDEESSWSWITIGYNDQANCRDASSDVHCNCWR